MVSKLPPAHLAKSTPARSAGKPGAEPGRGRKSGWSFPDGPGLAGAFRETAEKWMALRRSFDDHSADHDLVHDLRVASRRLLEISAAAPVVARRRGLRRCLRRTIRQLGSHREADVTSALVARHTGQGPGAERLRALFEERRGAGRSEAFGRVPSDSEAGEWIEEAMRGLEILSRNQPVRLTTDVANRLGQRLERRVERFSVDAPTPSNAAELHRARIAAKKLRYLLEVLPGRPAASLAKTARDFQRAAGDWHDAAVVERDLSEVEALAVEDDDLELASAATSARSVFLGLRAAGRRESLDRFGALRSAVSRFETPGPRPSRILDTPVRVRRERRKPLG